MQALKNVLRQRGSQIEQILPLRPLSIDQSEIGFLEWLHADFFQLLNPLYLPHDNCRPANACSACALFAFAKRMGRLCCGLRRLDFVQEELEWCRLPTATLENVQ
jgi:hypothetical protein